MHIISHTSAPAVAPIAVLACSSANRDGASLLTFAQQPAETVFHFSSDGVNKPKDGTQRRKPKPRPLVRR